MRVIRPQVRSGLSLRFSFGRPFYSAYTPVYRTYQPWASRGYSSYGYSSYGRDYGALRITDAPRYAEVFVDGYYVGVVDNFDGIFQSLDLPAGPHQLEIRDDGYESYSNDIYIQPGRTLTLRADRY